MNKPLILVVEDDIPVRNLITITLKTHGYRYLTAGTAIKETPILFGEDAKRFLASMQNVKPASQQEKQRVKAAYEKLKKIATFMM